jgi:hypothetical protein
VIGNERVNHKLIDIVINSSLVSINSKFTQGIISVLFVSESHQYKYTMFTKLVSKIIYLLFHHQPINVPTAGAQAFLMDYT